ncbi:MAG: hypothetical protein AAB074_19355 [Planctomycetota bacterium]
MTSEFELVLAAEDLDDLLAAAGRVPELSESDQQAARAIVTSWSPLQALANLLFHPRLIPEDSRLPAIFRALDQSPPDYFTLAAAVGVQSMRPTGHSPLVRQHVAETLSRLTMHAADVIAARAEYTLENFLEPSRLEDAILLLRTPCETARHNLVAWLARATKSRGREVVAAVEASKDIGFRLRWSVSRKLHAHLSRPKKGFQSQEMPLLTYIPNLNEACVPGCAPRLSPSRRLPDAPWWKFW